MNRIYILLFLLLCATPVIAADHYAADCSNAQITSKITAAASGDTIHVPAGTCTWTASVIIPANKTIHLMGAGSSESGTVITRGGGVNLSAQSANYTISGFRFLNQTSANTAMIDAKNVGWRIHGNYFGHVTPGLDTRGSTEAIVPTGAADGVVGRHPTGLIDNNTFADQRIVVYGESSYPDLTAQNTIWAEPNVWGTYADTVYIENNVFIDRLSGNVVDSNSAAKYVFRFNTISGTNIMVHSLQGASERGGKTWEIYNNSLTLISGYNSVAYLRGGTGFAFNNKATFASSYYSNTANIYLDNVRSFTAFGTNPSSGKCDGTSNWDGNILSNGWPCRDQIGRGSDTATDDSVIGKATSSEPAYFWGNFNLNSNSNIPVVVSSNSAVHIQANRDYYDYSATFNGTSGVGAGLKAAMPATCTKSTDANGGPAYWATDENKLYRCTDTNTWTLHYTPYTCPHPLADPDGEGSCDYAVAGTTGYTLTGGVTDTTPPTVTSFYVYSGTTVINFSEVITATSGAAFTVSGLASAMTLTCPAVSTAASSMTCTNSRTVYQAEGNGTYGYTGTKVIDAAENALATIDNSPTAVNLSTEVETPPAVRLTVNKTGSGCTITSSPSGIIAGTTTTADYDTGTVVTLGGYVEHGWNPTIVWGGDCASNGTVTMSGAKTCTATCTEKQVLNWAR